MLDKQAHRTGDNIVGIGDRLVTIARVDQVNSPFNASTVNFERCGWTDEFTLVSVIQVHDVVAEALASLHLRS